MSGFKGNQSIKPPYNPYRDMDADNACDQVVDFSKRYPDDPEEVCRPAVKNAHLSGTSVNSEETKQTDDELKVYFVEGTPLMESSASSYWDLSDVGRIEQSSEALIPEEQTRIEPCFASEHNFPIYTPDTGTNVCINSNLVVDEIHSFDQREKRESDKEEHCINQEAEASFTKSSSPLMFSRSSSVCSLNSFEQHSIVDDRSSVSAFSNLASGMISPSEIPDSPFEVASPFISKSKTSEFLFPSNAKCEDPVLVDETIPNGNFPDEGFGGFMEDDVKVYDDEGDCPSVSNLSALSIQANSTHVSISVIQGDNTLVSLIQKSSVTVNCSVTNGEADFIEKCPTLEISDQIDVLEQTCINTMPSQSPNVNQTAKTQSIIETKYEDKGTSTSEDFNFHGSGYEGSLSSFKDIKASTPLKDVMKKVDEFVSVEGYRVGTLFQQYKEEQLQSSDYSKENSDDESDDLLAECILNGMPSKDNSRFNDSKQSLNHSFQTSGSSLKESFEVPNCSFSDNDLSEDDDDDGILNECVLLGMPQKSNSMRIEPGKSSALELSSCNSVISNELPLSSSPSQQIKLLDEILLQEKQINQKLSEENLNLVAPELDSSPRNFAKEEEYSTFNLISQSKDQLEGIQADLAKSDDDDSDNDESDLLVQQIIQLGMPKKQLRSPKTKLPVTYPPDKNLGYRDNCPDGVSDGEDDDDDILNEIIKAGKPASKAKTSKSFYAESKPSLNAQNQIKLTAAQDRQLYLNNDYYENIRPKTCASDMGVDDYMHDWRTEGTPLLSPTASISDLSTLSFAEDKVCQESFLNNSRNSDCSSESEDDELLQQCIRQGMPGARRVAV